MDALTKKFKDYRSPDQSSEAEKDENVYEGMGKSIRRVKAKVKVLSDMNAILGGPHKAGDIPS